MFKIFYGVLLSALILVVSIACEKEKETLRKSEVNGPSYHLIKQILKQNNSKTWGDVLCETE